MQGFSLRQDFLKSLTQNIEWSVHSMCRTEDGYQDRIEPKVDAIKLLSEDDAWREGDEEDFEDAREIANMAKDAAKRWKGKGQA